MDEATTTALQAAFIGGIEDLKAPGLAIMTAGLAITLMVAAFKFMQKRLKGAVNA